MAGSQEATGMMAREPAAAGSGPLAARAHHRDPAAAGQPENGAHRDVSSAQQDTSAPAHRKDSPAVSPAAARRGEARGPAAGGPAHRDAASSHGAGPAHGSGSHRDAAALQRRDGAHASMVWDGWHSVGGPATGSSATGSSSAHRPPSSDVDP